MALPTITNNSPSAGRIAWSAFGIQYNGVGYSVPAGNSASKFIWWQFNGGTPTVQAADTLPNLAPEDYLLFLNKSGIGTLVDTTQVIDGSLIVAGSILTDGIGANQIQTHHLIANAVTTAKIAANAVTADEIAAGAVTASKLSIGAVGDNMVLNGSFEDGTQGFAVVSSGTGAVADVVTGVSSSGANALRLVRGTAANLIVGQDTDHFIPVTSVAGRSWYVACRAGAGSALASGFYLRVYWFQANKTTAASVASVDIASNVALTTAWSVFEGAATPPSNARYMRVAVINALSGSTMYVDEITAHEVVVSAQIGEGQITTPKIVANAVTAEKIAAGAIVAEKIAANAVTAAKIAAGAIVAEKIAANAVTADKIAATAIDGKTITGATIRTAASGQRLQMDVNGLRGYDSGNNLTASILPAWGGMNVQSPAASGDAEGGAIELYSLGTSPQLRVKSPRGEVSDTVSSVQASASKAGNLGAKLEMIYGGADWGGLRIQTFKNVLSNYSVIEPIVGTPNDYVTLKIGSSNCSLYLAGTISYGDDSGWVNLTSFGSGWSATTEDGYSPLRVRKRNGVVELRGIAQKASFTAFEVIATLPTEYRPATNLDGACRHTTSSVAGLQIFSDGRIRITSAGTLRVMPSAMWTLN